MPTDDPTSDPALALHPVRTDEVAQLTRLQRAAYAPWLPILGLEPLPYRADYSALLADHDAWFARGADGAEIGALILASHADHLLIWSVAVASDAARRGVGRALIAFAEAEAVRRNLAEVRLYTNALMARNIALYRRLGYRETHRETTPDGRNIVHMAKRVA
ncbi:MAG: family N-acetyltransferase [Rhodospirillales bacterium]|nr:family N-acetyltransferase [Rhodospirillales bacterium]